MTAEYKKAIEAHNAAIKVFSAAQIAYRARKIGDSEYIAALREYNAATAIFDAAFAKEEAMDFYEKCVPGPAIHSPLKSLRRR